MQDAIGYVNSRLQWGKRATDTVCTSLYGCHCHYLVSACHGHKPHWSIYHPLKTSWKWTIHLSFSCFFLQTWMQVCWFDLQELYKGTPSFMWKSHSPAFEGTTSGTWWRTLCFPYCRVIISNTARREETVSTAGTIIYCVSSPSYLPLKSFQAVTAMWADATCLASACMLLSLSGIGPTVGGCKQIYSLC